MPCKSYKSLKQRRLCFATKGWKDWEDIRSYRSKQKVKHKRIVGKIKLKGASI